MATRDDATLLMRILEWGNGAGAVDASLTLMGPGFDAEQASAHSRDVFVMLMMGEVMGTFTKQGLLDKALVRDLWAVDLMWARVGPAALRHREEYGEPALWENFEALAKG